MLDNRGLLKERIPRFLISMAHPAKLTGEAAREWIDKACITGKTRQGKKDWGQYYLGRDRQSSI